MTLQVKINNEITLTGDLPCEVEEYFTEQLSFVNPKWLENEKHGYWQGDTPQMLYFIEPDGENLIIPRGFASRLIKILDYNNVEHSINDETQTLPEVSFTFKGSLHLFQRDAVDAALKKRFGVLNAPTGSGKTVMALYLIAERGQPALVIVHSTDLMQQWRDRAIEFLGLSEDEIGLIGDGQKTIGERLTIGIVNSIYKIAKDLSPKIGFLIIDEAHRCPSRTFTEAVGAFDSKFMLGLSATPYRRDGLTKLIYFYLGDQVHNIEPKELQAIGKIMTPKLIKRTTNFDYDFDDDYTKMISELTYDEERNYQIANDVIRESNGNGISLVISDRKAHCQALYGLVRDRKSSVLLTGDISSKKRKEIIKKLNEGGVQVLVTTAQLLGEGFDLKALSKIFMATPIKFTGRTIQCVGRILRTSEGKEQPIIYDYVDRPGVLQASFFSRRRAYTELGVDLKEADRAGGQG